MEMNPNLSSDGLPDYDFLFMSTSHTFNQFQFTASSLTADKPLFYEHIFFLLVLVCKYMHCTLNQQVAGEFKSLSRSLTTDRKLVLAYLMLSCLYYQL